MPSRQLTVNGQPFYINTDKKAGVNSLTVNGTTTYIDRTAPVIDSDRKGESRPLLSKLVGDAAAAYSLRDLNDKQGNNKVVRVRRDTDDLEKDFVAKDVDKIADWVNGKQDTTLPCDVATAYQAYSLRKVKASYSGNAVRIRRSDNIEVDVSFDSFGKVSLNSTITNTTEQGGESGQTDDTTLGDFINGTDAFVHTWFDQAGSNNATQQDATKQPKIAENGALLTDGLKFDGTDDMLTNSDVGAMQASDGMSSFVVHKKRVASTSTSFGGTNPQYLYHLAEDALATTVLAHRIVGGQLSTVRANTAGDGYLLTTTTNHLIGTTKNLSTTTGSSGFQNHFNATTPSESVENTGTTYDSTTTEFTIAAQDGNGGSPTRFYDGQIEELIIYKSAHGTGNRTKIENNINTYYGLYTTAHNGFVDIWYDQSGNLRDAIQETETNQPSIVSSGSLITLNNKPAITFDGNDNFLEVDGTGSAEAYSFSPSGDMGMFIVSKQYLGNVQDSRDTGGDGVFIQQASSNTTRFRYNASANNIDVTAARDAQHLSILTLDGTTLSASVDGGSATNKTITAGVSTTHNLVLGAAFNNSNYMDGELQEVILYERKQTNNIPAIKANLNNHYQIYN